MLVYILTESPYTTEEVRNEILGRMEYDDLCMFIEDENESAGRYRKQAEYKKVDSLWREYQRLREDAVKYLKRAAEMGHPEAKNELDFLKRAM